MKMELASLTKNNEPNVNYQSQRCFLKSNNTSTITDMDINKWLSGLGV